MDTLRKELLHDTKNQGSFCNNFVKYLMLRWANYTEWSKKSDTPVLISR